MSAVADATDDLADEPDDLGSLLDDDPADLYENAPCGYLSTLPDGRIVKVNRTFTVWSGRARRELLGHRFPDLLTVGGRVFYETHLAPLLRMQGAVQEVALDLALPGGGTLPCLVNAVEVRDAAGDPVLIRTTLFEATSRRRYERALLAAQRTAAESEARSRTVQQVVSDLAAAVSAQDAAEVVVGRARAAVRARASALWLVTGSGAGGPPAVELAASSGLPPELGRRLEASAARGAAVLRTGQVRVVPVADPLAAAEPELAAALGAEGIDALVVVPVSADGRHLGVLVLLLGAAEQGDLIDLAEPGHGGDLAPADADLLWTIGRQAGQTLERVRLHEETARQAARSAFLLDAARLMAAAAGVRETVERLADLAVPRLADLCVIDLTDEHGPTRPAARHADPARAAVAEELRDMHLPTTGGPHPALEALTTGRTVVVPEVTDEWLASVTRDERHLALARELGLRSVVCVPLVADGRPLGVITLCADARRGTFSTADVDVAEQLALQVSQVVDKAQRLELETRTSHTLQANLLPPSPPRVEGLSVAVRYVAATRGADVGGDFYDVVPLAADQVGLAVGDVVGHDITAAATMGQLRSVYRALLPDRPPPSAVIDRLQAGWSLLGLQRMATALFGTLDPGTGQLRLASAGHLPPLLLEGGQAWFLDVRPSRMLGAPPAPSPAAEWAGVLPAGATLVLFTDGLVESRTADIDEGLAALLSAATAHATADPGELVDRLLEELVGEHRADDVALLAITRLP
ncbi:SpoIIE family protein phosphatase [Blastococcus sp. SYSU D00820]